MTRPQRPSAKARFLAHCDAPWPEGTINDAIQRAKTRRLLRLVIREELAKELAKVGERAYDAARVEFAHQCPVYKPDGAAAVGMAARTAVLARPTKRATRKER